MIKDDNYFMNLALREAKKAYDLNEVPIGCIITDGNKVISRAFNKREKDQSPLSHAESLAIIKACKKLSTWKLDGYTLYVTCEPCLMCTSLIYQTRIKRVVYGTKEAKFGALGSVINLNDYNFNHKVDLTTGIKESECSKILKDFFKRLREVK